MTLRTFVKTEILAVGSLLACCFVTTCLGMVKGTFAPDEIYADPIASPIFAGAVSFVIGLPFAMLCGAPVYFFMRRRRQVNWSVALLIGAAPAILFISQDSYMLLHALVVGIGTASFLQLLAPDAGPNNSFKPRPLRGSA